MTQKPDFRSMSNEELRKYVLEHREDDEAFYELSDRIRENGKPLNINELPDILERKRQA
jgi:hypothetical protein